MEKFIINEKEPKSHKRLGFNIISKDNNIIKNYYSKEEKMSPKMKFTSKNTDIKCLNYPLLKSLNFSFINRIKHENSFNHKSYEDNDSYNENAFKDEPEDFMHMSENIISINLIMNFES